MARGVRLGPRSRVDPAGKLPTKRPTTRIKRARGHRQGVRLAGYDAGMVSRTMRIIRHDQERALEADVGMFDR